MSRRRIALAAAVAPATASSSGGRWPSTSISVIAGVGEMRSSPPAKRTMPLRASSSRSDQPAVSSGLSRGGEGHGCSPRQPALGRAVGQPARAAASTARSRGSLARDLDRDGLRLRCASPAPFGQQIFLAVRPPRRVGARALVSLASRTVPARAISVEQDPRFDDLAVLDQRAAGFADPALDQPLRQADIPPTFSSTRVSASGRPTTLE